MRRVLVLSVALLYVGCGGSSDHPTIAVTPGDGLVDVAPRIAITGAADGAVVEARTVDAQGERWTSTTPLAAVRKDPTRPLWSMRHDSFHYVVPPRGMTVRLDLLQGGRSVAHTTIVRRPIARGVRSEQVRGGLYGERFDPPGSSRRAAALVIGGSNGGLTTAGIAALLASHGFPALALAYFKEPGLPRAMKDIPLEYFGRALERLRAQPDVDPRRVVVMGVSRGGEGALLIGATFPRLVHGVVALVPSNVVNPAPPPDERSPAWTLDGRPLPRVPLKDFGNPGPPHSAAFIRAERIDGPILTVSGGDDRMWPSSAYTTVLHKRLDARHFRFAHHDLEYPEAGHLIGSAIPYLPAAADPGYGGMPSADSAARAEVWPRIVDFMRGLRGG
jgi:dienelactone hydrolase